MKSFKLLSAATIAVFLVGCSVENSVNPSKTSDTPENVASVTTPQGEIQTVKTPDGSLCIFMRGANNLLYYKKQNSATGFPSSWTQIGGTSQITGNIATYCSGAYPIYVFSINNNNNLVVSKQTVNNGSWSTWQVIGGASFQINSDIAVAGDWDGKINVFARNTIDNKLYYLWQNSMNGSWSTYWYNLYDGQVWSKFAVVKHMNFTPTNGLTVFFGSIPTYELAKKTGGETYTIHALHQFASVGWVYDDILLDPNSTHKYVGTDGSIIAGNYADGRMIVFGHNGNAGLISYVYESTVGQQGWSYYQGWGSGIGCSTWEPLALGKNSDGRLELFSNVLADGENYHLFHRWQTAPNSNWVTDNYNCGDFHTVKCISPSDWGTRIVTNRFQNGMLAVFTQTSQRAGNPVGYSYCDCSQSGNSYCWTATPISLGNP